MSEFERLVVRGSPRERGRAHGERFADEVADNVEIYRERFAHEGLDPATIREESEAYVDVIESANAAYAAEMRGIADASGVPLADVAMLNVRWEVIYPAWGAQADEGDGARGSPVDGCTSFGLTPPATADGKTYVGENWDWLAPVGENLFLAELRREDAPDTLTMTEAGIVGGKIGVNEHGIGLAVNGLVSAADGENGRRKPYHVRFREVLDAERFDDALRPILEPERACSANVLIGHADGEVLNLEAAPERVYVGRPEDGILTHANHFEGEAVERHDLEPSTLYRGSRLRRLLAAEAGGIDPGTVQSALRDHFSRPASICSHVDESLPAVEHGRTNASFVIDLADRRLFAVRGPPCEGEYREYAL